LPVDRDLAFKLPLPARLRDDSGLAAKLHEIAAEEATAGYRTAWAYLRQDGMLVNHKRVQ
jgi:hypothetical protein